MNRQAATRGVRPSAQRHRKQSSHEQLLSAASDLFCARSYFTVSVEDIASAAGVSRMTFYRHFSSKAAIAIELFQQNAEGAAPDLLEIGKRDFRNKDVVRDWIGRLFASDRARSPLLRVFIQANVDEPGFTNQAHGFISGLIRRLGRDIPAFAVDRDAKKEQVRWVEAWLLLYEILDQSNHAALGSGVAGDSLVVEVLAERFLRFVARAPSRTSSSDDADAPLIDSGKLVRTSSRASSASRKERAG